MATIFGQNDKKGQSWNRYQNSYVGYANGATNETAAQTRQTSGGYGNPYAGNSASQAQDNYLSQLYNQFSNVYGNTDKSKKKGALNTDNLWQNYADQYVRQGRQSMRDTMGQYEAQTGGYGNSLATGAAAQAYYQYLDQAMQQWPTQSMGGGGGGGKKKPGTGDDELPIGAGIGIPMQTAAANGTLTVTPTTVGAGAAGTTGAGVNMGSGLQSAGIYERYIRPSNTQYVAPLTPGDTLDQILNGWRTK